MPPIKHIFLLFVSLLPSCKEPTPPPVDGDCSSQVCTLIENAENPDWSPTGERFAFLRIADSMLCLYYFADKHVEPLTKGEEPSFSPDGKKLAYEWRRRVYILDIDTRSIKDIAAGVAPAWSENGKWIAFAHPTSFKRRSTGEMIDGLPNPDSSLYIYDTETLTIDRIVINNLNPPTGPEVGVTYPTWVLRDSFIVFATEPQMAAVSRTGGPWRQIYQISPPNRAISERLSGLGPARKNNSDQLGAGRSSWNGQLQQLLFEYGEPVFPSGVNWGLHRMSFGSSWGLFFSIGDATDPSWVQDSSYIRIYVKAGAIELFDPGKPFAP